MKLKRCFVQNFGKLTDFSYEFNENLSVILQENGWGKSTFAAFIKAMLFGLPSNRNHDLDQNDRAKYTPWSGAAAGGWLEFTLHSTPYRVERTFGATQSKDVVKIYDLSTNQEIDDPDFIQNTLGINADTFMRSTYVGQGLFSSASDESIKAKLGKLLQDDSTFDLSAIDKKLLESQTALKLIRGTGGKIHTIETELEATQLAISRATSAHLEVNALGENLAELKQKSSAIADQIATLRATSERINKLRTAEAVAAHHLSLKNDLADLEKKHAEAAAFFGENIPTEADLKNLQEMQQNYEQDNRALTKIEIISPEKRLAELDKFFAPGVPTDQKIAEMTDKLQALQALPDNRGASAITSPRWQQIAGAISFGLAAILAILAITLGFVAGNPTTGWVLLGLTFASIICGCVIIAPKNSAKSQQENVTQNKEKLLAELTDFARLYHADTDHLADAIYNIKLRAREYDELKNTNADYEKEKEALHQKVLRERQVLCEYYAQFFDQNNDFAQSYIDIVDKFNKMNFYVAEIKNKQKQLAEFESSQKLPEIEPEIEQNTNIDEAVLRDQIVNLEAEKTNLSREQSKIISNIDNLSKTAENLQFYVAKEAELTAELDAAKTKWRRIKDTREFLQKAKDSLTAKYLSPLSSAFTKYASKMLGRASNDVTIDTDLNVMLDAEGSMRDTKYFSQGTRDIIELSLRLALVDTLFEGDLPPLILDDPFYNLDDAKTKNATDLIKSLSQEVQVIYLICHSSRDVR